MPNETHQDPYTNYDKDFVHTPEKAPSPIEIVDSHGQSIDDKKIVRPRRSPMLRIISLIVLTFTVLILSGAYYAYVALTLPATPHKLPVVIDIPKGTTLQETTYLLRDAGIIRSAFLFRSSMILAGFDSAIKTGEYTFTKPITVSETIERLVKGDYQYIPVRLTIKEGEDSRTITQSIYTLFPKLASSTIADELKIREGKLFPETYIFAPFATQQQILNTIDTEFAKRIAKYRPQIASSTHGETEILTIASILEKEVPKKEDMHIVSGIIYNRLAKNMPLQMDSTLGYITGKASLELTTEDLQLDSPYNTYKKTGLPTGPIGNPGDASIDAALHPSTHQYIFFLSDANGVNHYAVTYAEHLKNRKQYLGK